MRDKKATRYDVVPEDVLNMSGTDGLRIMTELYQPIWN